MSETRNTLHTAGWAASPPRHIAIIMDGNGRWATQRGLPRTAGHKAGAETFRRIATYCKNIGVKYLTVYAFSTENWKRSETEVSAIMALLKKYLLEFHADNASEEDVTLFYSVIRGEKYPLTSRTVQYILQKYGEQARQVCKEIPPNVHPHLFRHSRAMHLYQEGMDLTLISQWLGHSQLETTQIYAHADTEHKRRAIEASTPQDNPLYSKLNSARYTVTDEEMLKKLTGLR